MRLEVELSGLNAQYHILAKAKRISAGRPETHCHRRQFKGNDLEDLGTLKSLECRKAHDSVL